MPIKNNYSPLIIKNGENKWTLCPLYIMYQILSGKFALEKIYTNFKNWRLFAEISSTKIEGLPPVFS